MCVLIVIFSNNKKEYLTLNQSDLIYLSLTFSLLKKERRKLKKCLNFSKYFRIYLLTISFLTLSNLKYAIP